MAFNALVERAKNLLGIETTINNNGVKIKGNNNTVVLYKSNEGRMEKIENGFSKHTAKLIIFFKLIPGFAIPGLALAGLSKVSFKKFFIISLTLNLLSAILFTLLGFYSGITVSSLLKYLKLEKYILVAFGIFIIIIFILIKIFKKYYNQRLTRSM